MVWCSRNRHSPLAPPDSNRHPSRVCTPGRSDQLSYEPFGAGSGPLCWRNVRPPALPEPRLGRRTMTRVSPVVFALRRSEPGLDNPAPVHSGVILVGAGLRVREESNLRLTLGYLLRGSSGCSAVELQAQRRGRFRERPLGILVCTAPNRSSHRAFCCGPAHQAGPTAKPAQVRRSIGGPSGPAMSHYSPAVNVATLTLTRQIEGWPGTTWRPRT